MNSWTATNDRTYFFLQEIPQSSLNNLVTIIQELLTAHDAITVNIKQRFYLCFISIIEGDVSRRRYLQLHAFVDGNHQRPYI